MEFHSSSTHIEVVNGHRVQVTEKITLRDGKGKKTVISSENGVKKVQTLPLNPSASKMRRCRRSIRKCSIDLTQDQIKNIKDRKFMPDLFDDCYSSLGDCLTNSQRNTRRLSKTSKSAKPSSPRPTKLQTKRAKQ